MLCVRYLINAAVCSLHFTRVQCVLRVTRRFALLQTGTANASSLCTLKQHCACLQVTSELFPIAMPLKFRICQELGEFLRLLGQKPD